MSRKSTAALSAHMEGQATAFAAFGCAFLSGYAKGYGDAGREFLRGWGDKV